MRRLQMAGNVMILSAASGAGHVRAADAMVSAFGQRGIRTPHVEALKYTTPLFRKVYSDLYIELVNKRPEVLGWVYNSLDRPWKFQKRRLALDLLNTGSFVRFLKKESPSVALCTHFLPAEILVHLKKKKQIDIPIGIVVTDYDCHAMWLFKEVEWYFVACEETKVYLQKLGIPGESVHVTGIPIDPAFSVRTPREDARRQLRLDPEKTTVLVSAGGFGVGPMAALIESLDEMSSPVQFVVICGRNARLKADLETMRTRKPLMAVGYTTEMHNFMAASDFLVGKAGGLTSSEAFAQGLIPVIVNPVPGQEERNSDHFLEEGVALRCNNIPALAFKIDSLISDNERLKRMKRSVERFARPRAAADIADIVLRSMA